MQASLFTLEVVPERDRVRVAASGELDLANADRLEREIGALVDAGFAEVLADLRDLGFIDSSGVNALLSSDRHAREAGGRLSVALSPGPVSRTLELCGVRDLLDIADPA